jgi:hypothetical protein
MTMEQTLKEYFKFADEQGITLDDGSKVLTNEDLEIINLKRVQLFGEDILK